MANIASALLNNPSVPALIETVRAELLDIPVAPTLPLVIDEVPASALYFLADYFNVLGWNGWRLATTEEQRRELIRNAIRLQRTKGTPGAIRDIVKALGYNDIEIHEGLGVLYDGSQVYDGSINYTVNDWAVFRVTVFPENGIVIAASTSAALRLLIEAYKNARSHLLDITWSLVFEDNMDGFDEANTDNTEVDYLTGGVAQYDGSETYDGSQTYIDGSDTVNFTIFVNGVEQ